MVVNDPTPAFPDRERVLAALFESAAACMAILDGTGRILEANDAWVRATAEGACPLVPAGPGAPYLKKLRETGDVSASSIADAAEAVLAGVVESIDHELEGTGGPERWFTVRIHRVGKTEPVRVMVTLAEAAGARDERAREMESQTVQLAERVKEQRCLYAVSRALDDGDQGLEAMLTAAAIALPLGWQYPSLAGARITVDSLQVASPGFVESPHRQRVPIRIDRDVRGWIEVTYREVPADPGRGGTLLTLDQAEQGEAGIFLVEERSLLEEVAARVTGAVRRHRAEDRLRRSEAYFRALTEKGSDLISITAADGTVVYQSPPLMEALGLRPEERVGKSIFDRIHPDDQPRLRAAFGRALKDPSHQPTEEFRVQHSDGSWRVMESTGRNLLDDPAVNGVVVESRDVTARREAQDRIQFQAQILDLVGQAVVATDTDGRVTYWNKAAEEIYGWPHDEVVGRLIQEVIPLDRDQPQAESLLRAVSLGDRWAGELLCSRRDGSRFPALVVDTPIRDGRGTVAGYVAVATDISDRKAAEVALRASEEWSRALVENASDLTVVLDADGRMSYASPNRDRILGESGAARLGQDVSELLDVHPEDRPAALRVWADVYATPGSTFTATLRVRHLDGSWRTLECSARNLLENTAVRGVVVNCRDVTDRVHLEQQLQQARKMEAIGRLAGGVAHDFNNILTGIQGYTQLSLEELPANADVRLNLEEIGRAAERAARLTRQLLAFSRRQMMQPRVVDPNETVEELRDMLTRLIGEDVALSITLSPDAGCVLVDPGQLEQVIVNLSVNARDAMPTGGEVTIRTAGVRLEAGDLVDADGLKPGDYVELDVSDTGSGMPPEVIDRMFEPFFTTKEFGKGTGLGLSTVYGVVKQSGGHIRVHSRPGAGTTFRVLFPRVEGEPERLPERAAPAIEHSGETILLVEDDTAVRNLAGRVLRRRGYQVVEARDGAEAWVVFRSDPDAIHLVLSDVVMPELGGRELIERVVSARPGLPAILMSGYTDDVILRHGAREVGAAFLEKPFTPDGLAERVRATLDGVDDATTAVDGV